MPVYFFGQWLMIQWMNGLVHYTDVVIAGIELLYAFTGVITGGDNHVGMMQCIANFRMINIAIDEWIIFRVFFENDIVNGTDFADASRKVKWNFIG